MNLKDFRAQYPQYNSIPDADLAKRLHDRYYSDIPFEEFSARIGLTASTPQASQKLQADAFGGLTANPDSRLSGLTTSADEVSGKMTPASQVARGRKPLSESQKARVAEATTADYGRVISPTSATGVPIREELAPVSRQEVERLLAQETDPAKRLVLQDELKRPSSARQPIKLSPEEQAFAAEQATGRTTQDQLTDPEAVTVPTGPEVSAGSVGSGLLSSLGQGAELTRQGVRAQFADILGSEAMEQDALAKAGRVRNSIEDSTPSFESPTAAAAYSGLSSFVQLVPGLVAAIAAGNPVPALAAAGLQTEAEAYTRYRDRGATPTEALTGAVGEGAVEVLTEMMPMGVLVNKLGKTGTKNFLTEFLAREAPGEQVATLAQDALDTAIANPNKTWGEYVAERPNAAWNTLVATAAMGGAVGGVNVAANVVSRAAQLQQKADQAQSMITSAQSVDEALAGFNALSETLSQGAVDVSQANTVTGISAGSPTGGDLVSKRSVPDLLGGGASDSVYAGSDRADIGGVLSGEQTGDVGNAGSQQLASVEPGEDWEAFPGNSSLGIPRAEMPQIKTEHRGAMVNFLNARGVSHTEEDVDPGTLLPSQQEYSPSKVAKAAGSDRAILISKDNRVLDGHHQWLARMQSGEPVRAIRLNGTAEELLPQLKEFPSSTQESGASEVVEPMDDLVLPDVQSAAPTSEVLPNEQPTETAAPAGRVLPGTDSGASASRAGSVRLAELSALAQRRGNEAGATDLGAISVSPATPEDLLALPRGTRGSVESVAKAFGQNVVWYKPSEAAKGYVPDGFVVRGKADEADTIYLSVDGSVSPTRTAYHEVLHQLRNDAPDVYDEFSAVIRPLIDEAQAMRVSVSEANRSPDGRDGTQALGDEVYFEELAADIFSDSAHKPEFWLDVADRMTGEVASRFFKLLNTLLERVKAALSSDRTFNSDSYVKDLEAARKAAAKAAAQYYIRQKQRGKADLRNAVRTADQTAEVLESPRRKTEALGDFTYSRDKVGGITVFGDAQDIRSLLPDGVVGRVVKDGLAFTPADAPRVKGALAGSKLAYSRAGEVLNKLPMRNGKYLGAPPKYDTPAKIGTLRRKLRQLAEEGADGRLWYENSGKEVLKMVGGDVQEARKFVALLAIYSPQAKVDANSTFALRAWAQYKAGQPIDIKQKAFDDKANAAMQDVDAFWSGEKTGNFFNNLLREIDPATEGQQGATIDMWMMRAAEYPIDVPGKTQYSFMENETNRIARDLGWEPQQVQAAIWVAMKARMENPGVKKNTEASSEKKGWLTYEYPVKNGRPVKTRKILNAEAHRDNWLKHAFRHDPTSTDTALAKFDFGDGLRRHIGQISVEARPSTKLPILPGVHSAPYAQQLEFQNAARAAFLSEDGSDRLAQLLGLMVDTADITVPGVWEGEVSPSTQLQVAMAPIAGTDGKNEVDPDQAKLLDTYAAIAGLVLRQDGVGWHRPFYNATKKTSNGLQLDFGRPLNENEAKDIEAAIDGWMRENNKPANWRDQFAMISTPRGVRLVDFGVASVDEMTGSLLAAIDPVVVPGVQADWFKSSGNLVFNDWKEYPNGEYYIERASAAGRPDVLEWARDVLAPRVQSVFDEYSAKYGWGDPGKLVFSNRRSGTVGADEGVQERVPDANADTGGRGDRRPAADGQVQAPSGIRQDTVQEERLGKYDPLPGAPNVPGLNGPLRGVVDVAEAYARENGIDLKRQSEYVKLDEGRARRLADAYAAMDNAPQDPKVKEAYSNLIRQTAAQYQALREAGYRFWFVDPATQAGQEYLASPWNALRDLDQNQSMGVYPTADGFGSDLTFDASKNPLFSETGLEWPVGGPDSTVMAPVYANDLFRAVHDAFGHGLEGAGFRAQGEENAWQAHVRLFTGSAVAAITSETRGQNSWVNYGPQGEANRTASAEETFFADQKVGLMPEWTWTEGRAGDMVYSNRRAEQSAVSVYTPDTGLVDLFKAMKTDARLMPKSVRNKVEAHPLAAEIRNVQDNFLDILEQLETDGLVKINC